MKYKKYLYLITFSFLFSNILDAQTEISGLLSDMTLTESNSPYKLIGGIIVNGTLDIESNVEIDLNNKKIYLGDPFGGSTGFLNADHVTFINGDIEFRSVFDCDGAITNLIYANVNMSSGLNGQV